nr:unnamed protein product [Digitaria exilis]
MSSGVHEDGFPAAPQGYGAKMLPRLLKLYVLPPKVRGEIKLCVRVIITKMEKGEVVWRAGTAAMILVNDVVSGSGMTSTPTRSQQTYPHTHPHPSDGDALP